MNLELKKDTARKQSSRQIQLLQTVRREKIPKQSKKISILFEMYNLIHICIVNLSLNHQKFMMINDFNRFYMLARRLYKKYIELKFVLNIINATTELCSTAIEVVFLHTNVRNK